MAPVNPQDNRGPQIEVRIPIATLERRLAAAKARLAGQASGDDLVAKLAASLALRKVSLPEANCHVGRSWSAAAPDASPAPRPKPRVKRERRRASPSVGSVHPATTAAAVVQANAEAGLAAALSPSQLNTWSDCQARWWFKYGMNLPEKKTGNLAVGIAVHDALAYNYLQKVETRRDLPIPEVVRHFGTAWAAVMTETELREDEDAAELEGLGRTLVDKYLQEVAPEVQPIAVEQEISGEIGGVRINARPDLVEASGRIHDLKVRGRSPNGIEPSDMFQLATYAALTPAASGEVRIETLVKAKTPKLVQITRRIERTDVEAIEKLYPLAQEGMRSGLYMPNRGSMLCSRRNCSFWRACQAEFGGTVPEC